MTQAVKILKTEAKAQQYKVYGKHVYGNLYGCDPELLSNPDYLKKVIEEAARRGNMTLLDIRYWSIYPGVSLVAIVLESHITVHTWPEYMFATVDVYSCGEHTNPEAAFEYIAKALKAERYEYEVSDRSLSK
jgi:S-adenosylmethionine decarboxylase